MPPSVLQPSTTCGIITGEDLMPHLDAPPGEAPSEESQGSLPEMTSDDSTPLYDALSDRLLTGEDTLTGHVERVERLGRRVWLAALAALLTVGALLAGLLVGSIISA
jgi:hypothetical protein